MHSRHFTSHTRNLEYKSFIARSSWKSIHNKVNSAWLQALKFKVVVSFLLEKECLENVGFDQICQQLRFISRTSRPLSLVNDIYIIMQPLVPGTKSAITIFLLVFSSKKKTHHTKWTLRNKKDWEEILQLKWASGNISVLHVL